VLRSKWPNIPERELVDLVRAWAADNDVRPVIVFDGRAPVDAGDTVGPGPESADDWIAREAASLAPYWLVTSDRGLRARAGGKAERVIGGGSFARTLTR
jgi:hypothetical protein